MTIRFVDFALFCENKEGLAKMAHRMEQGAPIRGLVGFFCLFPFFPGFFFPSLLGTSLAGASHRGCGMRRDHKEASSGVGGRGVRSRLSEERVMTFPSLASVSH